MKVWGTCIVAFTATEWRIARHEQAEEKHKTELIQCTFKVAQIRLGPRLDETGGFDIGRQRDLHERRARTRSLLNPADQCGEPNMYMRSVVPLA